MLFLYAESDVSDGALIRAARGAGDIAGGRGARTCVPGHVESRSAFGLSGRGGWGRSATVQA